MVKMTEKGKHSHILENVRMSYGGNYIQSYPSVNLIVQNAIDEPFSTNRTFV